MLWQSDERHRTVCMETKVWFYVGKGVWSATISRINCCLAMGTLSVLVMLLTMTYDCQQYIFCSSTVTMVTRTRQNAIFFR